MKRVILTNDQFAILLLTVAVFSMGIAIRFGIVGVLFTGPFGWLVGGCIDIDDRI